MPNSNALKLLIRHSSGQLKMVEDYVGVYHMNLDGMEIKRKVDNYGISN